MTHFRNGIREHFILKIRKRDFRYYSELFIQVVVETEVSFVLECDAMYPASCGPRLGCGCDYPTPSSTKVKEKVELYHYSPSEPLWHFLEWTLL